MPKLEVYSPALALLGLLEEQSAVLWEEKAFTAGAFSVSALLTPRTRALLVPDNLVWLEGGAAGVIEYVEYTDREKGAAVTVRGRDLAGLLDRRILWGQYDLAGPAADVMRTLVTECCIAPTRGDDPAARVLPGLVLEDAPHAASAAVRVQITGGSLLAALETLGEAYGVAFGVRFDAAVPRMVFWARPGTDRSVHQSEADPVFYSTELDDVLEAEYVCDSAGFRNVALVAGEGEGSARTLVTVCGEAAAPAPETPDSGTAAAVGKARVGRAVLGRKES